MGMKRIYLLFTFLCLAVSCGKDPEEGGENTPSAPSDISFDTVSIHADASGGEFAVEVSSPGRPDASTDAAWISFTDGIYNKESYKITYTITVQGNYLTEERTGTVTFSSGSLQKDLQIIQGGVKPFDKSGIAKAPVNPDATASAKKLYSFLLENYGVKTLSGVQSNKSYTNDYVDAVYSATGAHPALAGYDFIFLQYSPTPASWSWKIDYTDLSAQKEHWNAGGIISYMWHWNVPASEEIYRNNDLDTENGWAFYSDKTNFDIREGLKDGTWQNEFILSSIDHIAITLKMLQEEGIPVLFRPLHEAAGNYTRYNPAGGAWFWWGTKGPEYCKKLWNLLRERLEGYHGLNNLIWVWTIDCVTGFEQSAMEWYPGDDKVDIVGFDVYEDNTGVKEAQFEFLRSITGGKKILTVSECGNIPSPSENLAAGKPWSWFMVWPTSNNDVITIDGYPLNTRQYWKSLMSDSSIFTRENMPSLK